jgi:DNA-directed RNA polymerase specialized sigma24 family protein
MDAKTYMELLRGARRRSRRPDEAEDLLQTALLAAIEAQRGDLTSVENRRWLGGVLRNRSLYEARSAVRRRRRDGAYLVGHGVEDVVTDAPDAFLTTLPPALRTTALLALTGHTRREIGWLLRLPDTALRQRISEIGRRWRRAHVEIPATAGSPRGDLAFGRIRRALLGRMREPGVAMASHDPDGHLFVLSSQIARARQQTGVNHTTEDENHVR